MHALISSSSVSVSTPSRAAIPCYFPVPPCYFGKFSAFALNSLQVCILPAPVYRDLQGPRATERGVHPQVRHKTKAELNGLTNKIALRNRNGGIDHAQNQGSTRRELTEPLAPSLRRITPSPCLCADYLAREPRAEHSGGNSDVGVLCCFLSNIVIAQLTV